MERKNTTLVSVDDNMVEPADMFERHLPKKWRSRAPRFVHENDNTDVWIFEGRHLPAFGLNAVVGKDREGHGVVENAQEPRSLEAAGSKSPGSSSA